MIWLARIFDFLASIRLAVIIILSILVVSAVGTIYEARFDAQVAQKLVYRSVYMYAVMIALTINLVAVMIDRWPWRRHHAAFVLAHIGIITLLIGSLITQRLGLDGSMAFGIGETNRYVSVDEQELAVYASLDGGERLAPILQRPVDFFLHPPKRQPVKVNLGTGDLEVVDYIHYGLRKSEILESDKVTDGPAARIQLVSPRVNVTQWILREAGARQGEVALGPAKVVLTSEPFTYSGGNVLVINPKSKPWKYQIYTASKGGLVRSGSMSEGDRLPTGWMDIELKVLRLYERAREVVTFEDRKTPSPLARPAVQIKYDGALHWLGLGSVLKLFSQNQMIWVTFANRRIDLGFPIKLVQFDIGHYQGTMRAASYESQVEVPGLGQHLISMNEPLKHSGFTFYQASFEQDEMGKPVASILSVNRDPGRFVKYLGCGLIVLGTIMLFYFRRRPRSARGGP